MQHTVAPGLYRHYKGGVYRVIRTALHSETLETLVVYQAVACGTLWVRPLALFLSQVRREDDSYGNRQMIERYQWMGE